MIEIDELPQVTTPEQLRELLGPAKPAALHKERTTLSAIDVEWLAASPLVLVATSDAAGNLDVSPKGDPPGFALVLDESTIAIPERPGNRRADGFHNMLANPHVGLIFLVPGRGDTLRINGRATLVTDAPFFDRMVIKGHRPIMATVVEIDTVFFHCSKAFLRSETWKPASWHPDAVPSRARIAKALERPDDSLEELEQYYGPSYSNGLYTPH